MRLRLYIALTFLLSLFACSDKKPTTPIKYPDQIPPAKVTSLWICVENPTWADLCWFAPGDDSLSGKATAYEIRYSRDLITDSTWDSCTIAAQSLIPRDPTTGERFRLNGLDSGATYFAALKAVDDIGNWSALSNVIAINAVDTLPPYSIGDLIGEIDNDSTITLRWTVPIDPESNRRLFKYDIRYSPHAINTANWDLATSITAYREPATAGSIDSICLKWSDTTRYLFFGIKVADLAMNYSPLSNVAKVLAPNIDTIPIDTAIGNDSARIEWALTINGQDFKSIDAIGQDDAGDIFVLSTAKISGTSSSQSLVMKFDQMGGQIWSTELGALLGTDASPDGLGGCYVFGHSNSCGGANDGAFVAHLNPNGDIIGQWCYEFPDRFSVYQGVATQDGGFALGGSCFVGTDPVAFLIKVGADGVEQWRRYPFQQNMCPSWGDPPIPAFASGGALCQSVDGKIILGTSFSYSDQVTITGCGFQWTHLMLIEFDPLTATESECQVTAYPDFVPSITEVIQFTDGRVCGLINFHNGAEYFITDPCRTSFTTLLPADQKLTANGTIHPVPYLAKTVVVGRKSEPPPASAVSDFRAHLMGETGVVEQQLTWGEASVNEFSPVVTVAPNGAVTVVGLRATGLDSSVMVISRLRFRL